MAFQKPTAKAGMVINTSNAIIQKDVFCLKMSPRLQKNAQKMPLLKKTIPCLKKMLKKMIQIPNNQSGVVLMDSALIWIQSVMVKKTVMTDRTRKKVGDTFISRVCD